MPGDSNQPRKPAYDRPNQPWVCGRATEGDPCAFGPGKHGVCPALAECQPLEIAGQWACNRPETRGGPCDEGPTPDGKCCRSQSCQPVRSMRSLRGVIVRSTALLAIGAMLMMFGTGTRDDWIAPGPLTSHHSHVLNGASWNNRCESCHAGGNQPVGGLLSAVVGADIGPSQPEKCMACHNQTIDSKLALVAHNVPLARLKREDSDTLDTGHMSEELACAVCHQEHHGTQHNLAAMPNDRCQACHTQKYESFAVDHPGFAMWPYERRTRIAFNHATHQGKYFAEKGRDFSCRKCHVEDATHGVQLTLGYDAACADCHDADIASSTAEGVPVLEMPMLDLEALAEVGMRIEDWPRRAVGDFDGKLPAIAKLLIARDEPAREALAMLGVDFDFLDIDYDDPQQLRAAGEVATAVSRLFDQLGQTDTLPEHAELLQGIDPRDIAQAADRWRSEATQPTVAAHPGDWFVEDSSLSIRYQPRGHADPVLTRWIDAVVQLKDRTLQTALLSEFAGPGSPGRCTTCHSIETGKTAGSLNINWRAYDGRQQPRGFTKFSHTPHLLPTELRDCTACHIIDPQSSTASNYSAHNPAAFTSDFAPLTKTSCASCHQPSAVGDSCTQCHNYHVQQPF